MRKKNNRGGSCGSVLASGLTVQTFAKEEEKNFCIRNYRIQRGNGGRRTEPS